MMLTGITRDGTFLIEKGKIVRPVKNFRFNQSIVQMLNSIDEIGKPDPAEAGSGRAILAAVAPDDAASTDCSQHVDPAKPSARQTWQSARI